MCDQREAALVSRRFSLITQKQYPLCANVPETESIPQPPWYQKCAAVVLSEWVWFGLLGLVWCCLSGLQSSLESVSATPPHASLTRSSTSSTSSSSISEEGGDAAHDALVARGAAPGPVLRSPKSCPCSQCPGRRTRRSSRCKRWTRCPRRPRGAATWGPGSC